MGLFFPSFKTIKNTIRAFGDYEFYRKAYVNWALDLSLWHMNTISDTYSMKICELLQQKLSKN